MRQYVPFIHSELANDTATHPRRLESSKICPQSTGRIYLKTEICHSAGTGMLNFIKNTQLSINCYHQPKFIIHQYSLNKLLKNLFLENKKWYTLIQIFP
jgi:hypothetical protein